MTVEHILRVISVRSENPRGFGGCIFSAKAIDLDGHVLDAASYVVVRATRRTLGEARIEPGQWWRVIGLPTQRILDISGYQLAEIQVEASEAELLRPSGEHIVSFMATSSAFEGIGNVKARRLWETFGDLLYEHLDSGNVAELARVLSPSSAAIVASAWAKHGDTRTLQWLQAHGFNPTVGRKAIQFFGMQTAEKIEEDPYRLLSFCAGWTETDSLARSCFGILERDPRRLNAAIEEVCYRSFAAGHTWIPFSKLIDLLQSVLGSHTKGFSWRSLIKDSLTQGLSNGSFLVGSHGVHPLGALVMERQVAQSLANLLMADKPKLLSDEKIKELIFKYQEVERLELNMAQCQAIHLAAARPLVLIVGSAGVGKTTVLKALYEIYDHVGLSVIQLALAGRAAKRMQEATGRPALTIANFLRRREHEKLCNPGVIVVDEASMVDIVAMNRLCELLGSASRIVLVGDPAQLMPVGPGLVLQALAEVPQVPVAELTIVKRYGGSIATAAASIREGKWPEFSADPQCDIAFIPCGGDPPAAGEGSISDTVLRLYKFDPTNTQILCARRNGPDGTIGLNKTCQSALTAHMEPVKAWDVHHGTYARVGLNLGDPVLCTRNIWDRGLQNGSMGVVVQLSDKPDVLSVSDGKGAGLALAWVDWDDGVRRPIDEDVLDDLELGYAVTVHKAQGSQWPRVIVPLTGHRLLDRTLIYTAVTRAQQQVLLVGDASAAKKAVEGLPRSRQRNVSLGAILAMMLQNH